MTTTSKKVEPLRSETSSQPVTLGGLLRRVDVDSGRAEFEWNGIDRPLYFESQLASDVQSLAGKYVQVRGIGTFNESDEELTRIELEAIRLEPGQVDRRQDDWPPSFNRDSVKSASFEFDVDEFLRGIYEARRD